MAIKNVVVGLQRKNEIEVRHCINKNPLKITWKNGQLAAAALKPTWLTFSNFDYTWQFDEVRAGAGILFHGAARDCNSIVVNLV